MKWFLFLLLAIMLYDLKTQKIPNIVNGILLIIGLLYCGQTPQTWGYLLLALVTLAFILPFPLGAGDKKLIALLPLFLQEYSLAFGFWLSAGYLVYQLTKAETPRPFAPVIVLAAVLSGYWG